ncbi:hypothetical protein UA3_01118 [Enterococcus faecium EnGen0263]|uniref:hypothetical protein n=1 Tax=Enterococcus faecium TaxID=1352 RepID=UPI00032E53A6|nr:hypothetical protein [Enterococcus faecium]EOH55935.1 hypothetical protein UA3_01118 [Enterococcus faecium EnGen0263]
MDSDFLEYPAYKKKYPDKTMEDWLIYSKQQTYESTKQACQEYKDEMTESEKQEAEQFILELEQELKDYIK